MDRLSCTPDNGLQPLPKDFRHPADYRDEIEHQQVAKILAELPPDHIAIYAYCTAARCASDTAGLSHLLVDRMDLVERLTDVYLAGVNRISVNHSGNSTDITRR